MRGRLTQIRRTIVCPRCKEENVTETFAVEAQMFNCAKCDARIHIGTCGHDKPPDILEVVPDDHPPEVPLRWAKALAAGLASRAGS